jgi:hypothetical protein
MDIDDLELMKHDKDWTVRYEIALRAGPALLAELVNDTDEAVREVALQRSSELLIDAQ